MGTAINAISVGGIDALAAVGVALVFGVMRLANFAYGATVMVAAYATYLFGQANVPWPLTIVGVLCVAAVISIATERLAFRPVRHAEPVTLLMTSFALSYFVENAIEVAFSAQPLAPRLPAFADYTMRVGGTSVAGLYVVAIVVAGLAIVGLTRFLRHTRLGTEMRASAEDLEMTRLLGVQPSHSAMVAFGIMGVLAGIVALVNVADAGVITYDMGLPIAIIAFAGVVVGGMESLLGAAVGGFVIGALTIVLQTDLPSGLVPFYDVFVFGAVIVILLVRPQGLVGARGWATRRDAT